MDEMTVCSRHRGCERHKRNARNQGHEANRLQRRVEFIGHFPHACWFSSIYMVRLALSAASASSMSASTMPVFFPVAGSRKSPSFTKLATEATAPPCGVDVGRMIETGPSLGSRNSVGSGMIKFVWNLSAAPAAPVLG